MLSLLALDSREVMRMKQSLLYEGKAKKVYTDSDNRNELILSYKNDATALNGKMKEVFVGKGELNNAISSFIFTYLHNEGITSHFLKQLNETEQRVQKTTIIPLEVVVRNKATGSITKRLGLPEKTAFAPALIELFYKDDSLDDPLINDDHVRLVSDVTKEELQEIKGKALEINTALIRLFYSVQLDVVDFKLEFGRLPSGEIILADEISPEVGS